MTIQHFYFRRPLFNIALVVHWRPLESHWLLRIVKHLYSASADKNRTNAILSACQFLLTPNSVPCINHRTTDSSDLIPLPWSLGCNQPVLWLPRQRARCRDWRTVILEYTEQLMEETQHHALINIHKGIAGSR